jgi:hypothetical protein
MALAYVLCHARENRHPVANELEVNNERRLYRITRFRG